MANWWQIAIFTPLYKNKNNVIPTFICDWFLFFTLIEMMIVMIIISILVLLIIPNASNVLTTANEKGCEAFQKSVTAIQTSNKLMGKDDINDGISVEEGQKVCGSSYTIPNFE